MSFFDGFDQFEGEQPGRLPTALQRAGYIVTNYGTGSISIAQVAGRLGVGRGIGTVSAAFSRSWSWSGSKGACGVACISKQRVGPILTLDFGDGAKITVWLDPSDGHPRINNGDDVTVGQSIPVCDVWYYYELELNRSTGTVDLYINNKFDCSAELTADMLSSTEANVILGYQPWNNYLDELPPNVPTSSPWVGADKTYDDFYAREGDRWGPIIITTRKPTNAVQAAWLFVGGDSNVDVLSRLPPEPLDRYTGTDQIGATDEFTSDDELRSSNGAILGTALACLTRKSPLVDGKLRGHVGDNVNAARRAQDIEVEDAWKLRYITFDRVMTDTKSGIEDAPFGVQFVED